MNKNAFILFVTAITVALLGCRSNSAQSKEKPTVSKKTPISVAKKYLATKFDINWTKKSDQDWEKQRSIKYSSWATVLGTTIFEDKGFKNKKADLVFVELSKDKKKYYDDYYFLIEKESLKIVSIKKRKWDG